MESTCVVESKRELLGRATSYAVRNSSTGNHHDARLKQCISLSLIRSRFDAFEIRVLMIRCVGYMVSESTVVDLINIVMLD